MAMMKVGRGRGRDLLLIRQRGVSKAHLLRHRLREDLLERRQGLPGGVAEGGRALDLHRTQQVEPGRQLGPSNVLDGDQGREGDHLVGRLRTDVDLADVLGLQPGRCVGLHVDPVESSEAVEVVDVGPSHDGRHRLEDLIHRNTQRARLLAIQVHLDLRVVRVEGGEEVPQFGPLPSCREELPCLLAEFLDASWCRCDPG